MLTICLKGNCKNIQLTPNNGEPARCQVWVELDHDVPLTYKAYDIQLLVPVEFATLLEVGRSLTITVEQDEN